jgi:hypothetical protein
MKQFIYFFIFLLAGCTQLQTVDGVILSDASTTWVSINSGIAEEVNPLLHNLGGDNATGVAISSIVLSYGALTVVGRFLPQHCTIFYGSVARSKLSASVNNLAVMLGLEPNLALAMGLFSWFLASNELDVSKEAMEFCGIHVYTA